MKSRPFCLVCGLWLTVHCSETHLNENYRILIKTCLFFYYFFFIFIFFFIYRWFVLWARFENVDEVSICISCKTEVVFLASENQNYLWSITLDAHPLYTKVNRSWISSLWDKSCGQKWRFHYTLILCSTSKCREPCTRYSSLNGSELVRNR